jgi:PIN domain nuclease of toxin-antitoxin system
LRLLLDTHTFLWFSEDDAKLSRVARRRIVDVRNERFLSIASIWEMAIKIGLGKLRLGVPLPELVQSGALDNGIAVLPIEKEHAIGVANLPAHHGDPFDRLLVVQARHEGMTVVGADEHFDAYGVRRVW